MTALVGTSGLINDASLTGVSTDILDSIVSAVLTALTTSGLTFVEGANKRMGKTALVSGSATVANTSVTAKSRIYVTNVNPDLENGWGNLNVTITPSTGFVIASSNNDDASDVAWLIVEAA